MGRVYLIAEGAEIVRRRPLVPAGRFVEAWPDHYVAGDFWLGEDSKALLDGVGTPIKAKLSLPGACVPIYYGQRLRDVESLPMEESVQARVLSAHGVAVAWITDDQFGNRTKYEPRSPTDPIFFLRRAGGGAIHLWRLFGTKPEAVEYMGGECSTDPEALPWAQTLPAETFEALLTRHATHDAEAQMPLRAALEEAEKFGPDDPRLAERLLDLAALYRTQGQYAEADPLYLRALGIQERILGPEHPRLLAGLDALAAVYDTQGQHTHAEPLYRRALAIREKALGPDHPDVARSLDSYAALLRRLSRTNEATLMGARATAIRAKHAKGRPE